MMNVSDISESLGIKLTTDFIVDTLGVDPDGKDKRATLFEERKFPDIKQALIEHIESASIKKAPKKTAEKPTKPAAAATATDDDDY